MQQTQRKIGLATKGTTTDKLVDEVQEVVEQCTTAFNPLQTTYKGLKSNIEDIPTE